MGHRKRIARAHLYGLMAGGSEGVDRAIEVLREEVVRTMQLRGVAALDELSPRHATQLARPADAEHCRATTACTIAAPACTP